MASLHRVLAAAVTFLLGEKISFLLRMRQQYYAMMLSQHCSLSVSKNKPEHSAHSAECREKRGVGSVLFQEAEDGDRLMTTGEWALTKAAVHPSTGQGRRNECPLTAFPRRQQSGAKKSTRSLGEQWSPETLLFAFSSGEGVAV